MKKIVIWTVVVIVFGMLFSVTPEAARLLWALVLIKALFGFVMGYAVVKFLINFVSFVKNS